VDALNAMDDAAHTLAAPAWWTQGGVLQRFVADLLQAEMALLRPGGWPLPAGGWRADLHLVHDLGADSLELMALSTALADAVRLRDADAADALYAEASLGNWLAVAQRSLATGGGLMGFRSSGSTGAPKSCVHRLDRLWQEMQAMAAVLGPVERLVSTVRSHHIYGFLFTVLLPHALGAATTPVLAVQGRPPASLPPRLARGDLLIAFPELWQALSRLQAGWPEGVRGVSSTAPCPPATAQALEAAGLARLFHIYGSSETAGVGWRDTAEGPYRLHPFWQRDPQDSQTLWRMAPAAEPEAHRLPDAVHWLDERHFLPGGRLDGAVQIGGVNVHLAQVRQLLLRHPAVADAALRTQEVAGQLRLKAFVVPREPADAAALAGELATWGRRHLAPAARPVSWTVGPELPRNAMGKASDWPV
jgi:long-chain acyl-CoA synthetase